MKPFEAIMGGVVVVTSALVLAACVGAQPSAPVDTSSIKPPEPNPIVVVNEVVTRSEVDYLVEPLGPAKGKLICSRVTISNNNDADVVYDKLEWHIEYPDGTHSPVADGGTYLLGSGTVAGGTRVVGNVCFPDKAQTGETAIVLDPLLGGSDPIKWYQDV